MFYVILWALTSLLSYYILFTALQNNNELLKGMLKKQHRIYSVAFGAYGVVSLLLISLLVKMDHGRFVLRY